MSSLNFLTWGLWERTEVSNQTQTTSPHKHQADLSTEERMNGQRERERERDELYWSGIKRIPPWDESQTDALHSERVQHTDTFAADCLLCVITAVCADTVRSSYTHTHITAESNRADDLKLKLPLHSTGTILKNI